jgi:hypothetical protein
MPLPSLRESIRMARVVLMIVGLAVAGCAPSGTGGAAGKFSSQKAADRFKPVPVQGPSRDREKGPFGPARGR